MSKVHPPITPVPHVSNSQKPQPTSLHAPIPTRRIYGKNCRTNYSNTKLRTTSATFSMTSWLTGFIKVDKLGTTSTFTIYHRTSRNYKRSNRASAGHKSTMDDSLLHGYKYYRPTTHTPTPFGTMLNASLLCGKQFYKYGQYAASIYIQALMNKKIDAIWKWIYNKSLPKPNQIPTCSHLLNT